MGYVQMTLEEWAGIKQKLEQEIREAKEKVVEARKGFIRAGYLLRRIKDGKLYEQDGYRSITEFAQKEYNLGPSDTSHLIKLNQEYSVGGYSDTLRPEYTHLGKGQLVEMMGLPEKDRAMVQPGAYREDIRELKRFNREPPEAGAADGLVQLVSRFYEDNPEILKAVYRGMPFGEQETRRFVEAVNPGGNRSYRKGLYFLMMYESRVSVKKFGEPPGDLTWQQFYDLTKEAVGEAPPDPPKKTGGIPVQPGEAGQKTAQSGPQDTRASQGETAKEEPGQGPPSGAQGGPVKKDGSVGQGRPGGEDKGRGQKAPAIKSTHVGQGGPQGGISRGGTIAPAQKNQETQVKGEDPGTGKEPGGQEEAALETAGQEIVETPFETRKRYMDKLTAEEAARYIREEYDRGSLQESYLAYQFRLTRWLLEKVDGYGVTIKDAE